jgi:hypothetical protein
MKSDDSKEFELDEPAAKSRPPLGWPIQTIEPAAPVWSATVSTFS